MSKFCYNLKQLSGELYIESEAMTDEQYEIHDKNRIGDKTIFSRSCQLRRVDNTTEEIFVAAPLFAADYLYFKNSVILLRCENRVCVVETSANFFQLEEKYIFQLTGW